MENDDKRVRKNRKISKDTESDRSRIKNITNKVHPEYEVPKKRPARRTEEDEEMARKRAEARKETASGTAQEDHTQAQTETGTQTGCSVPGDRGTCGHCFFC